MDNIINILNKLKYEVNYQVVDYESKVIAVLVSNEKFENYRYIPCFPSKMYEYETIDTIFIDELSDEYFAEYNDTKDFLEKIYVDSNEIIQCKPQNKVVEDELVVGILTNANQFVMLSKPALYINDELEILSDKNYIFTDTIIQNKFDIDNDRREMINNIKLESGFYNSFRNTVLKLLSEYKNMKFNIRLQDIIKNNAVIYFDKIKLIREELESLVDNYVMFAQYDPKILNGIKNFSSCINNTNCDSDYCMVKPETNICNLIIPDTNLITSDSNVDIYFTKLADEFARYNKTKLVLFNPSKFISFNNIKYNINNDEVIIMESALAKEITTSNYNIKDPYSNLNTFDTQNIKNNKQVNKVNTENIKVEYTEFDMDQLKPNQKVILKLPQEQIDKIKAIGKKYEEEKAKAKAKANAANVDAPTEPDVQEDNDDVDGQNISDYAKNMECKHKKLAVKEKLNKFFVPKIYEFFFNIVDENTQETLGLCSTELILYIIKHHHVNIGDNSLKDMTGTDIKNILIDEYFYHDNTEALLVMAQAYNKNSMTTNMTQYAKKMEDSIFVKTDEFKNLLVRVINDDAYVFNYVDIYLLAMKYKLPIILVSNSVINAKINLEPYVILNKNENNDNYYFIKLPSSTHRGLKNYKLLISSQNNISTLNVTEQIQDADDKFPIYTSITERLKSHTDLFIGAVNKYHNEKVEPKNRKLLQKLNK